MVFKTLVTVIKESKLPWHKVEIVTISRILIRKESDKLKFKMSNFIPNPKEIKKL